MSSKNSKTECSFCGLFITNNNIALHISSHLNPKSKLHKPKKIRGIDFDPNKGFNDGSRSAWNKGLTKDSNEIL